MAVKRSRTGCLTCRHRKLKCDEQKPVCSQCRKAIRQCIPSQGIVFRHHQNASMNTGNEPGTPAGLEQFYRYKKNFDSQTTVWVEIPKDITFVEVTNPYAEDSDAGDNAAPYQSVQTPETQRATGSYAHSAPRSSSNTYTPNGLAALSEAAMDQYAYIPQGPASDHAGMRSLPSYAPYEPQDLPVSPTTSRQLMPPPASPSTTVHTNVRYLLNQGGGMSDVIDPNLQMPMEQQVQAYDEQTQAAKMENVQQKAVSGQVKVTRQRVSSGKPRKKQ